MEIAVAAEETTAESQLTKPEIAKVRGTFCAKQCLVESAPAYRRYTYVTEGHAAGILLIEHLFRWSYRKPPIATSRLHPQPGQIAYLLHASGTSSAWIYFLPTDRITYDLG